MYISAIPPPHIYPSLIPAPFDTKQPLFPSPLSSSLSRASVSGLAGCTLVRRTGGSSSGVPFAFNSFMCTYHKTPPPAPKSSLACIVSSFPLLVSANRVFLPQRKPSGRGPFFFFFLVLRTRSAVFLDKSSVRTPDRLLLNTPTGCPAIARLLAAWPLEHQRGKEGGGPGLLDFRCPL